MFWSFRALKKRSAIQLQSGARVYISLILIVRAGGNFVVLVNLFGNIFHFRAAFYVERLSARKLLDVLDAKRVAFRAFVNPFDLFSGHEEPSCCVASVMLLFLLNPFTAIVSIMIHYFEETSL